MRRILSMLAVAGLFAAVAASAATLGVDGGAIQVGEDLSLTCDNDGVSVDGWGLESDTSLVNSVRLVDVSSACNGNALFVKILGSGGTVLGQGSVDPITGSTVTINFTATPAADITGIRIFVEGPGSA